MAKKRKGFWSKFDDLMDSLPEYIDNEINTVGEHNTVSLSNISSSSTTVNQNGKKIVIKTSNGKTTVTVNGKEYVPKGENK